MIRNGAMEGIELRVEDLKLYKPLSYPASIIIYLFLPQGEYPFKYFEIDY